MDAYDIAMIRARVDAAKVSSNPSVIFVSVHDVPELCDEVERLQVEVERLQRMLDWRNNEI